MKAYLNATYKRLPLSLFQAPTTWNRLLIFYCAYSFLPLITIDNLRGVQ